MRALSKIGPVLLFASVIAATALADERDRLTYLTFSVPVQLPGVTLSAGTYTFRLADPEGDRHAIQILNKQNGKLVTTLMTIPNMALDTPKDPFVMFEERPAAPPAMKAWFYPGNSIGEEFIYPKKQAVAIAKANHEPVLATETESTNTAAFKTGKVAHVDENGNVVRDQTASTPPPATSTSAQRSNSSTSERAPRSANAPSAPGSQRGSTPAVGTSGQTSRPEQTSRATNPSTSGASRSELPQTASSIVVIQALSGLFLAGAFGLRWLRKGLSMLLTR